jgi:hypothetical protein
MLRSRREKEKKRIFETLPNEIKLEFEYIYIHSLLISLPRLVYKKRLFVDIYSNCPKRIHSIGVLFQLTYDHNGILFQGITKVVYIDCNRKSSTYHI